MKCYAIVAALVFAACAGAQKKPLEHADYDVWHSFKGWEISRDGKWLAYAHAPAVGDGELVLKELDGPREYKVERGANPKITADGQFVVFTIAPPKSEVDKAKKDKKKPAEMPKSSLGILAVSSGKVDRTDRVASFTMSKNAGDWIAFRQEAKPDSAAKEAPKDEKNPKKKDHAVGTELTLHQLSTGTEKKLPDVADFQFFSDSSVLVYTVSSKTGDTDGIYWLDLLRNGDAVPIMAGLGNYKGLAINDKAKRVAFLTDRDDYRADLPAVDAYLYKLGDKTPSKIPTDGIASGYTFSIKGACRFSDSGARVFLPTIPKPVPEKKSEVADDEKPSVDVWNWKDGELQPAQLLKVEATRNKTYDAMYVIGAKSVTQLENPDLDSVTVAAKGDGDYAIGGNAKPYRALESWDTSYEDVYWIDARTGAHTLLGSKMESRPSLSPGGKYAIWFDGKVYRCFDFALKGVSTIAKDVPTSLVSEVFDLPQPTPAYGISGWTTADRRVIVEDRYDLWSVDPQGREPSVCLTRSAGRVGKTNYSIVRLDPEADSIDLAKPILLSGIVDDTKAAGFSTLQPDGQLIKRITLDKQLGTPTKAKYADRLIFTRQDAGEYPNLWSSDLTFSTPRQLTDLNPQQSNYNWNTTELVNWTSLDGKPLQGILFKPEDFDPGKKYPLLVYFYERLSNTLHAYHTPAAGADAINPTFYASRGYLVFMPDIPYQIGYPGDSALKAILPGVNAVADRGYVDRKHIGMQGHSWGGYQVAYLATQTNMFACGVAGAAVSDMISAYGGIRWATGISRQFQYEKTQSRIGGSLWQRPLQFIENSPIFWADKIETPLLLMNNDNDGAVPWYQGIEFFTALRRLNKPCWMLNYNGEGHGLSKMPNRKDYAVRMQQFFDCYLKGAPMPKWMSEGVPAKDKGK